MKTNISTAAFPHLSVKLPRAARHVGPICKDFASKAYKGLAHFGTNLQIGRMETVLHRMTDKELAKIGIARSEIARHARFLISHD